MKSIPVSKIDALIARLDKERKEDYKDYGENASQFRYDGGIRYLEEIKKESEEMIPLSIEETVICELETEEYNAGDRTREIRILKEPPRTKKNEISTHFK